MGEAKADTEIGSAPVPVERHYQALGNTMLIVFGGILGAMGGLPPFEFGQLTQDLPVSKLFVRDLHQAWYHQGLPGIARNVSEIEVFLHREIEIQKPQRVVLCGNSMGGYAALLFGALLKADVTLVFSPQTFIGLWQRLWHFDRRWSDKIANAQKATSAERRYFDLKEVLQQANTKTRHDIYFSENDWLDKIHARRLSTTNGVVLHPFAEGGHRLVKHLRDTGELSVLVRRAVQIEEI